MGLFGAIGAMNNNKIVWAITMLVFNVGSRFVLADISDGNEHVLNTVVFKQLVVFCMFFVATRDIALSVVLTVGFVVCFNVLLRRNVDIWCMIPGSARCQKSLPLKAIVNDQVDQGQHLQRKDSTKKLKFSGQKKPSSTSGQKSKLQETYTNLGVDLEGNVEEEEDIDYVKNNDNDNDDDHLVSVAQFDPHSLTEAFTPFAFAPF